MARIKGSNELYKLIHSLTAEEKGYFKKFAQRHTSSGNQYLQLFELISKQSTFEETELKQKFKSYARMKVYLKDLITDAMLIYYRNNHPHIHLLNQIQKIHLLLVKGLYHESLRLIEKALVTSNAMELFTMTRYLERVKRDLHSQTFNQKSDMLQLMQKYQKDMDANMLKENNLTAYEMLSMEWFAKSRGGQTTNNKQLTNFTKNIQSQKALSTRAEIKKTEILNWVSIARNDQPNLYKLTKRRVALSMDFRKKGDSSFYTISALDNHILSCISMNKFDEAESLCNLMIVAEDDMMLYYNLAFVWGNLRKWMIYIVSGNFEKGFKEMNKTSEEILQIISANQEAPGMRATRAYYMLRAVMLFCNKKYLECWMCLNESLNLLRQNSHNMPDVLMLQMMVQLELGNYSLIKNMAVLSGKKLNTSLEELNTYRVLIDFFKKVNAENISQTALLTLQILEKERKVNGKQTDYLFSILPYTCWLESKKTTTSLEALVKRQIGKK